MLQLPGGGAGAEVSWGDRTTAVCCNWQLFCWDRRRLMLEPAMTGWCKLHGAIFLSTGDCCVGGEPAVLWAWLPHARGMSEAYGARALNNFFWEEGVDVGRRTKRIGGRSNGAGDPKREAACQPAEIWSSRPALSTAKQNSNQNS